MANQIILKKSSVQSKVPGVNDLAYGELAINYADGKLYYKTSTNTISAFTAGSSANGTVTSISATSTDLTISGSPITSSGTLTFALNTVSISKGGTGITTTPTNGQLLIGNGSGYSLSNITAGSGISVTNNTGTITISNSTNGSAQAYAWFIS